MIEELLTLLADTDSCYQRAHLYHWNITGPSFVGLHSLLNDQYEALIEGKDAIAERIRALGVIIPPDYFTRASSRVYLSASPWRDLVADMVSAHTAVLISIKSAIQAAEEAGDQATLNLLADRQTWHEDAIWRLKSHLQ